MRFGFPWAEEIEVVGVLRMFLARSDWGVGRVSSKLVGAVARRSWDFALI
jgi:hypothetical protein